MIKKEYLAFFDSAYSLLVFLLVHTEKKEKTLFLFSSGIPNYIIEKTSNVYREYPKKGKNKAIQILSFVFFHIKIRMIVKDLLNRYQFESFYGQDHIFWSNHILNYKKNITVFEDGFSNYMPCKKRMDKFKKIKKLLKIEVFAPYGVSDRVSKIYLTGLMPVPEIIKDKVEIIDLQNLWDNKNSKDKEYILNVFDLSNYKIEAMSHKKILLLTQPFSEEKIMSEQEKVELYREMLEPYKVEDVLIKPHPREKTDYKKFFPEYEVVSEQFPVQLFKLNNIRFEEVITVFSTAANDFLDEGTKLVFKGTKFNDKLYKLVGNIFYDQEKKEIKVQKYEEK